MSEINGAARACIGCGTALTKRPGRGRWPKRCPPCAKVALLQQTADSARRNKVPARPIPATCVHCGAEFVLRPVARAQKYCSRDCKRAHDSAVNHARYEANRPEPRVKACRECGAEFLSPTPYKTLCPACHKDCRGKILLRLKAEAASQDAKEKSCTECGATFVSGHPAKVTCSEECRQARGRRVDRRTYDERRKYLLAWREQHPEYRGEQARRRRAAEADAEGGFTEAQWRARLEVFGHRCAWCGNGDSSLVRDHLLPLSRYRLDHASNIVPSCWSCNSRKRALHPADWVKWRIAHGMPVTRYAKAIVDKCRIMAGQGGASARYPFSDENRPLKTALAR